MRIVVTGRDGQVARALAEVAPRGIEVVRLGRPKLDLEQPGTVAPALEEARPDLVVSAAAYTAVDKAENEPERAFAINAVGAGAVAAAAAALRVPVLHLSTDYVFDGTSPRPYREDDPTAPLGVYGRSKLAGEQAVAAAHPGALILRTAWIYAPFGANFVRTMLRLATTRDVISVVADQRGCPTSALDIAQALIAVGRRLGGDQPGASAGVFNLTGSGEATWADVAEAIFACSAEHGGPTARVARIATTDYPTPARRPAQSRLDGSTLSRVYGITLPDWRLSLATCVSRLLRDPPPG